MLYLIYIYKLFFCVEQTIYIYIYIVNLGWKAFQFTIQRDRLSTYSISIGFYNRNTDQWPYFSWRGGYVWLCGVSDYRYCFCVEQWVAEDQAWHSECNAWIATYWRHHEWNAAYQTINLCKSPQANYVQAQRLCRRMGIRCATNSKPAKHLSYDHPEMEAVRSWVECSNTSHGVNLRLIANFDQVWTCLFEHKKKVLYKPPPKLDGASITQGILKATNIKDRAWYGKYFLSVILVHIYNLHVYMYIFIFFNIYICFFNGISI